MRHPDFINLKHKIQNCDKPEKLERLRNVIVRYGLKHSDRAELMTYFLEKEWELNPEKKNEEMKKDEERIKVLVPYFEDETLTQHHRNSCGAQK